MASGLSGLGKLPSVTPKPGKGAKSRAFSKSVRTDMSANKHPASAQLGVEVTLEPLYNGNDAMARPPPPPPLTRPILSTKVVSFAERRVHIALLTTGDLDNNFFSQPNPDYTSSSSSSALRQPINSPATPRRRSYTKTLPLGPPQPVPGLEEDGSVTSSSPSSFPSLTPTLPLTPHKSFRTHGINVKGEIISVLNNAGAGWKRHIRVYGGGVCLACTALEGKGEFYGHKVRPEEQR
ncbi:hypothetical protein BKA67DRAFT_585636 [Truncatella angustata]|uniref:Uncharacterized protein n=1 Tax=Truncatella angustata TaxID=152316 RepID=A0A9P8RGU3_9PEZI|nr:uncharacterized protein BKA67DRAFT_585636 [Truncatella angustata]KAH6645582.1 hypothetical protein BKA67DRAFT_585636 [Truncatella angustata]